MREYLDYINEIYIETCNITKFIEGINFDDFVSNLEKFYAVTRSMEIMGEAAKRVPQAIKEQYPEIEWSKLARLRDKLIHSYYNADERIIWNTAKKEITKLSGQLKNVIDKVNE